MSVDPNNLGGTASLTFDDEFNTLNLWNGSSGTWSTTFWYQDPNGTGANISATNEQEWYINAGYGPTSYLQPWTVNNGVLTLTAAPASSYTQSLIGAHAYTSGEINTYHAFAQTYGYFEVRAELPAGQGFWPAFWLMPENGATLPELDAMEVLSDNPDVLTTTSHSSLTGMLSNNATVANTTTGFHTYGIDWEPDFITWYFDGQAVYQIATPADMDQPMYMILNLAAGGNYAGATNGATGQMLVDWVRAYSALNPAGSADTVYDAATNTVSTNGNYTLQAGVQNLVLTGSGQTVYGNNSGDVITSDNNNNVIIGGAGDDTIFAGRGHDYLTGGGGDNTFVYVEYPWDIGQITDFKPGQDQVDLRGIFSQVGYTGSNPVGAGYLSLAAYGSTGTEVLFNPSGGGASGASIIFIMDNVLPSALQVTGDFIVGVGQSPNLNYAGASGGGSSGSGSSSGGSIGGSGSGGSSGSPGSGSSGQTYVSDNNGDHWTGTSGNDTFDVGRGGDVLTGAGGSDTYVFAQVPWARAEITDFSSQDSINLSAMFTSVGYTGTNPVADGHLTFVSDGNGGTQVWFNTSGLPVSIGSWEIVDLDHVAPSSLSIANGVITETSGSGGSSGSPGSGSSGQTYVSDNNGDHWTGTSGNDTFDVGRGGDVLTGAGGSDTYVFAQVPWAHAEITDFSNLDTIDLSGMFASVGYAGTDPLSDGHLSLTSDGNGGTQVWFNTSGLPVSIGSWEVVDLDHVAPSSLSIANGVITETSGSGGSSGSPGSGSSGQTYVSDNNGDHWTGTSGNDTFDVGRGGDVLTGNGGSDTYDFAQVPWAHAEITDFSNLDTIDLSGMFASVGYAGSDPLSDGHLSLTSDGNGGTEVWFNTSGLPVSIGSWEVVDLDHVAASSLHVNGAYITG